MKKNVLSVSDEDIAKTFKKYFEEIMSKLKIIQNKCYIGITENIKYAEKKALCKYRNHPSITISKTLYYQKDFLCQC